MTKEKIKKDPLKALLVSSEWTEGYNAGVEYGILKERKRPQILRYGVRVKKYIVKKFPSFNSALKWADWNYKVGLNTLNRKVYSIVKLI